MLADIRRGSSLHRVQTMDAYIAPTTTPETQSAPEVEVATEVKVDMKAVPEWRLEPVATERDDGSGRFAQPQAAESVCTTPHGELRQPQQQQQPPLPTQLPPPTPLPLTPQQAVKEQGMDANRAGQSNEERVDKTKKRKACPFTWSAYMTAKGA